MEEAVGQVAYCGSWESRDGDRSYSGWNQTESFVLGTTPSLESGLGEFTPYVGVILNRPCGMFACDHDPSIEVVDPAGLPEPKKLAGLRGWAWDLIEHALG